MDVSHGVAAFAAVGLTLEFKEPTGGLSAFMKHVEKVCSKGACVYVRDERVVRDVEFTMTAGGGGPHHSDGVLFTPVSRALVCACNASEAFANAARAAAKREADARCCVCLTENACPTHCRACGALVCPPCITRMALNGVQGGKDDGELACPMCRTETDMYAWCMDAAPTTVRTFPTFTAALAKVVKATGFVTVFSESDERVIDVSVLGRVWHDAGAVWYVEEHEHEDVLARLDFLDDVCNVVLVGDVPKTTKGFAAACGTDGVVLVKSGGVVRQVAGLFPAFAAYVACDRIYERRAAAEHERREAVADARRQWDSERDELLAALEHERLRTLELRRRQRRDARLQAEVKLMELEIRRLELLKGHQELVQLELARHRAPA